MGRSKQTIDIPLRGLDLSADEKAPAGMLRCHNVVWPAENRLAKRDGMRRATSAAPSAVSRLTAVGDVALGWGNGSAAVYDPVTDTWDATTAPTSAWPCSSTKRAIQAPQLVRYWCTAAERAGILVVAAMRRSPSTATMQLWIGTYNATSLVQLAWTTVNAGSSFGAAVATSGALAVVYQTTKACVRIISAAGAIGAEQEIGTELTKDAYGIDACAVGADLVVLYQHKTSGDKKLAVCPGADPSAATIYTAASPAAGGTLVEACGVYRLSATQVGVLWAESTATTWDVRHQAIAIASGTATLTHTYHAAAKTEFGQPYAFAGVGETARTGDQGDTIGTVFWSLPMVDAGVTYNRVVQTRAGPVVSAGSPLSGNRDVTWNKSLWTKPVKVSATEILCGFSYRERGKDWTDGLRHGDVCVLSASDSYSQFKPDGWSLVGRCSPGLAGYDTPDVPLSLSGLWLRSSGAYAAVALECDQPTDSYNRVTNDALKRVVLFELTRSAAALSANVDGRVVYLAGSVPRMFDGATVIKHGWDAIPEPVRLASTSTGGPLTTVGAAYRYVACWAYTDASGRVHRSFPTTVPLVVTPASASESWPVFALPVHPLDDFPLADTAGNDTLELELYRTGPDLVVYRKITIYEVAGTAPAGFRLYTSVTSDASLESGEQLYTIGGVLGVQAPPPHDIAAVWQSRLVCASTDNGYLWYSKAAAEARPFECSDVLAERLRLDGPVTALVALADRLIVSTESASWALSGTGRDGLGNGAGYDAPYLLSSVHGCTHGRSVVALDDRILMRTASGLIGVSHAIQVTPLGSPTRLLSTVATVLDAVVLRDQGVCVLVSSTGDSPVFDFELERWATWDMPDAVAACAVGTTLLVLDGSRYVWRRTPATYQDYNGTTAALIPIEIDTGWLSFAGMGGEAQLWSFHLTAQHVGAHKLRHRIGYDYDPDWFSDTTFDPLALTAFASSAYQGDGLSSSYRDKAYTIEMLPDWTRRMARAVRLRLTEVIPASGAFTAGPELVALSALVAQRYGGRKLDDTRRSNRGT